MLEKDGTVVMWRGRDMVNKIAILTIKVVVKILPSK